MPSEAEDSLHITPHKQRIFHPFYSTKDTGTGLGLALARKIVLTHGGSLILQHTSSAGSTFLVTLPKSPARELYESSAPSPSGRRS